MNWKRIPVHAMACLMMLPCAAQADVTLNVLLNPQGSFAAYYPGLNTTIVQTDFLMASGPVFPDLTGASGNLILNLVAPAGQEFEVLADVTRWSAGVRFNGGSFLSFVANQAATADFISPSGSVPALAGANTVLYENSLSPGALVDVQVGLLSSDPLPSGLRFGGISFALPISAFSGFTQTGGLAAHYGQLQFILELPGDQTSTAPSELAKLIDVSAVPEPGTALLLGLGLAAVLTGARRRRV